MNCSACVLEPFSLGRLVVFFGAFKCSQKICKHAVHRGGAFCAAGVRTVALRGASAFMTGAQGTHALSRDQIHRYPVLGLGQQFYIQCELEKPCCINYYLIKTERHEY